MAPESQRISREGCESTPAFRGPALADMEGHCYQRESLPNGLRVIWHELPHLNTVSIVAAVQAGPCYEPAGHFGASHFLEHLHMSSTEQSPSREEFHSRLAQVPGHFNAYTGTECVSYHVDIGRCGVEAAVQLLCEILTPRHYGEAVFEAERALLLSETDSDSESDYFDWLSASLFPRHIYGTRARRTRRDIRRIGREKLHTFDMATYRPQRIVVAVAGSFESLPKDRIRDCLSTIPDRCAKSVAFPDDPSWVCPIVSTDAASHRMRQLNIGFLSRPSDETPQDLAMWRILDSGLLNYGSRLFERLRYAVSSTYQISTACLSFRRSAAFAIHGLSPRSSFLRVVEEVLAEYSRLRAGDVPNRWFESTRDLVAFESQSCVDSAEGAAAYYATAECSEFGNGPISLREWTERCAGAKLEDFVGFLRRHMRRDTLFLCCDCPSLFRRRKLNRLVEEYFGSD